MCGALKSRALIGWRGGGIDEIDKSIEHLRKTKEALLGTDRNLHLAKRQAEDVTIKMLTKGNPTMPENSGIEGKGPSDGWGRGSSSGTRDRSKARPELQSVILQPS